MSERKGLCWSLTTIAKEWDSGDMFAHQVECELPKGHEGSCRAPKAVTRYMAKGGVVFPDLRPEPTSEGDEPEGFFCGPDGKVSFSELPPETRVEIRQFVDYLRAKKDGFKGSFDLWRATGGDGDV